MRYPAVGENIRRQSPALRASSATRLGAGASATPGVRAAGVRRGQAPGLRAMHRGDTGRFGRSPGREGRPPLRDPREGEGGRVLPGVPTANQGQSGHLGSACAVRVAATNHAWYLRLY